MSKEAGKSNELIAPFRQILVVSDDQTWNSVILETIKEVPRLKGQSVSSSEAEEWISLYRQTGQKPNFSEDPAFILFYAGSNPEKMQEIADFCARIFPHSFRFAFFARYDKKDTDTRMVRKWINAVGGPPSAHDLHPLSYDKKEVSRFLTTLPTY